MSAPAYTAAAPPTTTAADAQEVEPALSPAQAQARHCVERAARRFLAGYLPYSYGRAPARSIRGATPALRRELATNPPRVAAVGTRSARPRVRELRVSGLNGSRAYVLAQVDDGSRTYATSLTIQRRGGRWLVAEVQ
jgi:hypothetical protein